MTSVSSPGASGPWARATDAAAPSIPPRLPDGISAEVLEQIAMRLAREAGQFVVEERPRGLGVSRTKSTATDVVTVMDQRCQDLLRQRLAAARPDDGFFGEEEGGRPGSSGVTWVVDPIDGTVNYLYEIPAYAVSLAAVVGDPQRPGHWRPVAAAVVDPVAGELFHAREDCGSWRADAEGRRRQLFVEEPATLGTALVGTGFGYDPAMRVWQAEVLVRIIGEIRDIRRIGSAALDLCHVADGRLDLYFERGLRPWDLAAGWLILSEAGGRLSGLGGRPPGDDMVVAGGRRLHPELEALLRRVVGEVDASAASAAR
jgi:myo-inositol-1(or 4)-monophosphatase